MANANIKISQLPSIGSNLNLNTLLPVVSTNGTYLTDKVTVGNLANFVLNEAGNLLSNAFVSTIAYSVANSAQPNITSVGNLTGLTITTVNNFHIPGGVDGYYLQTDGTGNLAWVAGGGSGNGEVGGSDTQIQFNNAGLFGGSPNLTWAAGNLVTTGIKTDGYFFANGDPFTSGGSTGNIGFDNNIIYSLAGSFLDNSDLTHDATAAFIVPNNGSGDAQVNVLYGNVLVQTGPSNNLDYTWKFDYNGLLTLPDGTEMGVIEGANTFGFYSGDPSIEYLLEAAGNVWSFNGATGNLTLPTNASSINYANGDPYGAGPTNTGNVSFNDVNIIGTGNLKLQPDPNNTGAYLDVYLTVGPDIHIAGNGENVILGRDTGANVTVGVSGNVSVRADSGTPYVWGFNQDGSTKFPDDTIKSINGLTVTIGDPDSLSTAWYSIYGDINNPLNGVATFNGSITYDSTGNIYVLGSIVDFSGSTFQGDSLFLKYNSVGELLWHKTWTDESGMICGSVNASMRYQPITETAIIDTILWASYVPQESISYIGTMDLEGNLVDITGSPRAPTQLNNYRITDVLSINQYGGSDGACICGVNYDLVGTGFYLPSISLMTLDNSFPPQQWLFSTPDMETNNVSYFKSVDIIDGAPGAVYAVGAYLSNVTYRRKAIIGLLLFAGDPIETLLYQVGDNYPNDNIWFEDTCVDVDSNTYAIINNDNASGNNVYYTVVASTNFIGDPGINRWQKKISAGFSVESMGLVYSNGYTYVLAEANDDLALFKLDSTTGALVWSRIIASPSYEGNWNGGSDGYDSSSDLSVDPTGNYISFSAITLDKNIPSNFTIKYPVDGSLIGQYGDFTITNGVSSFTITDHNYTLVDISLSSTVVTTTMDVTTASLIATASTAGAGWGSSYQALVASTTWTFDNNGGSFTPNTNDTQTYTKGSITTIQGNPNPVNNGSQTLTDVYVASNSDVIAVDMTLRVQSTAFVEIIKLTIAKETNNDNLCYSIDSRLKTNDLIDDTIIDVDLNVGNKIVVAANCQTSSTVYYTYDVKEYRMTN